MGKVVQKEMEMDRDKKESKTQKFMVQQKNYHTHTQVHGVGPTLNRAIPLSVGHNPLNVGNHTGRIKVVFTPTICKMTCTNGRCQNSCQQGNTTTIISENGHATDTLTAPNFRVVVCHLPCMNGGKCSARDKCQCPPNFTGKFCQMANPNGHQGQHTVGNGQKTHVHSTHTLPLTYGTGQNQGLVNVHVKHPPEASVQIHQVSPVDSNGQVKNTQSSHSFTYHSSSQSIQHGHTHSGVIYPNQQTYPQYQPVTSKSQLGRCFQETAGMQCGKALPGLSKQDACCGTVGTSWGFHKCQKCPKKTSIPLIECPQGYKRLNATRCIAAFKDICPGGMGYHVTTPYIYKPKPPNGHSQTDSHVQNKPTIRHQVPVDPPMPFPTLQQPVEALSITERQLPEVVEKVSPPAPVAIPPSIESQDISPTQLADVDECAESPSLCANGRCQNTPGGFLCVCELGFMPNEKGTSCSDIDECEDGKVCPSGLCYNTLGSFMCSPCPDGFEGRNGQCVDINECLDENACAHGQCSNREGYFICTCDEGFSLTPDGKACIDIDECQDDSVCIQGHCQNTEGSFICNCEPGFILSSTGDQCNDVDECLELPQTCDGVGQCVNILGSYQCNCPQGYRQVNGTSCHDVDECEDETQLCVPNGECLNTEGSFLCVCDAGFVSTRDPPGCEDIDECADFGTSICGVWACQNTPGSYRCEVPCPPGLSQDEHGVCIDVDECSLNENTCGSHGVCQNTIGSFSCQCDPGFKDSQDGQGCVDVNECELLGNVCGEATCENREGTFLCLCPDEMQEFDPMSAKCFSTPPVTEVERKECYFNLNDENLCDNVLASSMTKEECCCTLGAGWGDNCEVHPCPIPGTDQFSQMCLAGRGYIPPEDSVVPTTSLPESFKDADECKLFEKEICKDGFCLNTPGGYECYCKAGLYYDESKLQCVGQRETDVYQGICWETVTERLTCTKPIASLQTTFTECCCLYGEAWGMDCALCPQKNTEAYATMCNIRQSGGPRRPYGQDALVAGPVAEYGSEYDSRPLNPDDTLPLYEDYEEPRNPYDAFEGLRAEECGVLNGCENGRCVRVQEGYTCDCFDGYTLDMSRMACVDINECSELNTKMSLCKNGKCINTQGSYKCVCLPGFVHSAQHNYCVPQRQNATSTSTE
ncbi:latent-transforming growth factor beta-binding 1-like isoform X1 [Labeo rohita]|uniref:Latent-transforming growth factor beta-binding protein 2 n=1 Tax=Labeo rohita TaxID=84645 RepID=A0A498NE20_LABRO|nr:latent-transforming growth factor beta-binding 1-like isoform X1 [Labeo rohita]